MKIAIPSETADGMAAMRSGHFGHCAYFTVVEYDDAMNITGVDASIVAAPDGKGGSFASARSIGDVNVQLIMEALGGGGNRSAAAAQFADTDIDETVKKVYQAIDDYLS